MSNNLLIQLKDATIENIENGENGVQPAIIVTTADKHKYMITITNSQRFLIMEEFNY